MAVYTDSPRRGFVAAADYSAKQYHIVKLGTNDNEVTLATAATDVLLGTLMNTPTAGDTAEVQLRGKGGTAKVKLGGTVAKGDRLTTDGNSKAIATTTAGNQVLGIALYAGVANDVIEFLPVYDRV